MFSETYVQTTACLSYIRSAACVTFNLINSPFIMGRNVVVLGRSDNFSYGVLASESYPDVCVLEYVCDFAYLWGNVCECCPSFVFVRVCVYYGAFCLMFYLVSKFLYYCQWETITLGYV